MRAHPICRVVLALVALALVAFADRSALVLSAVVIASGFVLGGQVGRGLTLIAAVLPFVVVAMALWLWVNGQGITLAAGARLVEADAPFLRLMRALLGSSALVLALATVPDGESRTFLRRVGASRSVAFTLASGLALHGTIGDAVGRSLTALRAQGMVRPGRLGILAALGPVVAQAWVAALGLVVSRSEVKWYGSGFAEAPEPAPVRAPLAAIWGSLVLAMTAAGIVAALFTGGDLVSRLL